MRMADAGEARVLRDWTKVHRTIVQWTWNVEMIRFSHDSSPALFALILNSGDFVCVAEESV